MGRRNIGSVGLASSGVPDDLLTTKGDTHGYSTTNARIPIGANDTVLTADSSEALGLKWATPGGVTTNRLEATGATNGQTTTSTSLTQVSPTTGTDTNFDLSNQTGGSAIINFYSDNQVNNAGSVVYIGIDVGGSSVAVVSNGQGATSYHANMMVSAVAQTNGDNVKMMWAVNADTGRLDNGSNTMSRMVAMEVY